MYKTNLLIFKIVLVVLLFQFSNGSIFKNISSIRRYDNLKIEKLSNCKVKLDDNSIIDLTQLDNPSKPRSSPDTSDEYLFYFNPCSPIECDPKQAKTSAVCQKTKDNKLQYDCGDQDSVNFDFKDSLIISYSSGIRTTDLQCLCANNEEFKFISENPRNNYNFQLKSKCCCPNKCLGGKSDGLSLGSILLIIFFSCFFVYFIGGFIFLKFLRKESGSQAIPNLNFWISLPSDIKSGFSFTISKVKGNRNQYSQI